MARLLAIGLAVALTAGCGHHAPTGQVLATVNGQEITTRDLQAELIATGTSPSPEADKRLLDTIVTRRLVAAEGRRLGLDQSPDYLAQLQRGGEALLGSQMIASWAQDVPAPTPAAVRTYAAAHPLGFADRRLIDLDQIVTGPVTLPPDLVGSLKTMAAVEDALRTRGVTISRRRSTLDTATAPDALTRQLIAMQGGEPIFERTGDHLVFSAVTAIRPAPLPPAAWPQAVTARLRAAAVEQRLAALRKSARISRQADTPTG